MSPARLTASLVTCEKTNRVSVVWRPIPQHTREHSRPCCLEAARPRTSKLETALAAKEAPLQASLALEINDQMESFSACVALHEVVNLPESLRAVVVQGVGQLFSK